MPCFSYFLYFTCGRFSTDARESLVPERKDKDSFYNSPMTGSFPRLQGECEKGFWGEGRGGEGKKKWLNTTSEIDGDFKLINFPPTFPFWCRIDISNLIPNQNTWFPPPLSKLALTHLIKSFHWSPSFLCQHRSHPRFLSLYHSQQFHWQVLLVVPSKDIPHPTISHHPSIPITSLV